MRRALRNKPSQHGSQLLEGQIVASFGRRYLVELPDSSTLDCVTRGKRGLLACGDRVTVARSAEGRGVIEAAGTSPPLRLSGTGPKGFLEASQKPTARGLLRV